MTQDQILDMFNEDSYYVNDERINDFCSKNITVKKSPINLDKFIIKPYFKVALAEFFETSSIDLSKNDLIAKILHKFSMNNLDYFASAKQEIPYLFDMMHSIRSTMPPTARKDKHISIGYHQSSESLSDVKQSMKYLGLKNYKIWEETYGSYFIASFTHEEDQNLFHLTTAQRQEYSFFVFSNYKKVNDLWVLLEKEMDIYEDSGFTL